MIQYRISKYNPANKIGNIDQRTEWTEYSDVGKVYGGRRFTKLEYLKTERAYLDLIADILHAVQIEKICIHGYEPISWWSYILCKRGYIRTLKSTKHVLRFARGCLRNYYWGKLSCGTMFIHFGYDYYVYIGCLLNYSEMQSITMRYGLFCELVTSPYSE